MATGLYQLWKKALMDASTNSNITGGTDATNGPYVALVTTAYTGNLTTDQFYSTVTGNAVGTPQNITLAVTTVGSTPGVFSGGNVTFTAVTGSTVTQLVIYRANSGANTTWRLMSDYDTPTGGLPVVPNGGNITITWNASGIFQLSDALAKHEIHHIQGALYRYRYKVSGSPEYIGLIAQDVERVCPQALARHDGMYHVNYEAALGAYYA